METAQLFERAHDLLLEFISLLDTIGRRFNGSRLAFLGLVAVATEGGLPLPGRSLAAHVRKTGGCFPCRHGAAGSQQIQIALYACRSGRRRRVRGVNVDGSAALDRPHRPSTQPAPMRNGLTQALSGVGPLFAL